jgi:hypothetical protein
MNDKMYKALIAIGILDDEATMIDEQMKLAIGSIKLIRKYAIMHDHLNDQLFLDFMDEINKLSIDPEQ